MAIKVGVIAEGPTDMIVFESFFGAHIKALGHDVEFFWVQPADATSSSGYTEVMKWCKRNSPEIRALLLEGGLFEGDLSEPLYDILAVHIDADSAKRIARVEKDKKTKIKRPLERGDYVEDKLISWLWPGIKRPNTAGHIIAPATDAIEAWLVCALVSDPDAESITNLPYALCQAVINSGLASVTPQNNFIQKTQVNYRQISSHGSGNYRFVYDHCIYFQSACKQFEVECARI